MDPDTVVIEMQPASAPPENDALAEAAEAASQIAQAAAVVASAAAMSPENNQAKELRDVWERMGLLESMLSGLHEKCDAIMSAIQLLAIAEEAEAIGEQAEIEGDEITQENANELQQSTAGAAAEIVAETIPEVPAETPQIRQKSSRRFV